MAVITAPAPSRAGTGLRLRIQRWQAAFTAHRLAVRTAAELAVADPRVRHEVEIIARRSS